MERHAALGWFVNDIHRHPLPYHFIRHAVRLAHMNRLVLHDAPVSVGRAFVRRDWLALIAEAGLAPDAVEIVWRLPFKYGVGRIRRSEERRGGKECDRTCRSRGWPFNDTKNQPRLGTKQPQ